MDAKRDIARAQAEAIIRDPATGLDVDRQLPAAVAAAESCRAQLVQTGVSGLDAEDQGLAYAAGRFGLVPHQIAGLRLAYRARRVAEDVAEQLSNIDPDRKAP